MGQRIKKLRTELNLTQVEFCKRIGLKRNSISLVETGMRNISDQSIFSICREFQVNEDWLRYGKGEMFSSDMVRLVDKLADEYHLSSGARILIEKFIDLPEKHQDILVEYFEKVSESLAKNKQKKD
ncbi:MAG: helix-turn-helix domain-containing protein [Lachnospiraceae bacterium]|nr:helix-turn-helix domain-containing protein [Lachnospiraceae bacterium]